MDSQKQKVLKMTTEPVERLVCKMAVPTIISMMVTAFYNMADTFFVGHIKGVENATNAVGAVGVAFSLMAIIQACGFFFGNGSGNFISRKMGSGEFEKAERMTATAFFSAFIFGIVIAVVGVALLEPLTLLLGATPKIIPLAKDYLKYILIASPFMISSLLLNNQLRFQGSAVYGMVGIGTGAVLNIALDPLLIFYFDMGVAGAALATMISQICSFCILFVMTLFGDNIKIKPRLFTPTLYYYRKIFQGGLPSLCRQGLAGVATTCLNHSAGVYGEAAIAGMSVVTRSMMFAYSAVIGFGQGFQPVCGINYGAKLYHRVRKAFYFCVKVSTIFLFAASAIMFIFAPQIIGMFGESKRVAEIGAAALRYQCLSLPLASWIVFSNMMLQTIGKTFWASFLAMARQGIMFIPLILILPQILNLQGVLISQTFADVLSVGVAIPVSLRVLKQFKEKKIENPKTL